MQFELVNTAQHYLQNYLVSQLYLKKEEKEGQQNTEYFRSSYEGHLRITQNVDIGVTCSCLKYGVFITTRFDAMRICIQHYDCSWPRKSPIRPLFVWG